MLEVGSTADLVCRSILHTMALSKRPPPPLWGIITQRGNRGARAIAGH